MFLMRKYGSSIFFGLLLVHCLAIYAEYAQLRIASKLCLVPFLLLWLIAIRAGRIHALVWTGLITSFLGDLLLTFSGDLYFLTGMLAFAAAHICNGIFFLRMQRRGDQTVSGKRRMLAAGLSVAILASIVIYLLKGRLGAFEIPVMAYMVIIGAMTIAAGGTAGNRALVVNGSANCFATGAGLFVLSDGLLALNKFSWHQSTADVAVMLLYGAAQYWLVKGFAKTTSEKNTEAAPR